MPIRPVRYKAWFAAFVVVTVALRFTSSDAIDRPRDNNSHGAALGMASVAGADSIPSGSSLANTTVTADPPARAVATAAVVDVALLPAVDQAIYYWVGRTRGLVRSRWPERFGMDEARTQ